MGWRPPSRFLRPSSSLDHPVGDVWALRMMSESSNAPFLRGVSVFASHRETDGGGRHHDQGQKEHTQRQKDCLCVLSMSESTVRLCQDRRDGVRALLITGQACIGCMLHLVTSRRQAHFSYYP